MLLRSICRGPRGRSPRDDAYFAENNGKRMGEYANRVLCPPYWVDPASIADTLDQLPRIPQERATLSAMLGAGRHVLLAGSYLSVELTRTGANLRGCI